MQSPENSHNTEASSKDMADSQEEIKIPGATNDATIQTGEITNAQPDWEHLLKEAEIKAAEHHDAWIRAKAETENIRKRAQTDVSNAHKYAIENFSAQLLTVMDSLDAALAVENATIENFKSGMELTQKQLTSVFDKFNIKVIDPKGEKFDPHQHQAMCTIDSEQPPNTVVQVMQKGYKLHERIIRPALVSVSKAKDS
ncbi:nucleotide exchange factor GrpE [Nitrosomonas sp. Is35]|uniref:nucleotide exchange factor GrpE n=1 Tax=unclassified Nitrosomonas TaxID=2609265 RepID=UPI00294AE000|nr:MULTISPECIES: nucleotide exchange factor GrpE [unclassified Nitrosomonas]MDV6341530.1 nucleotide exchange factor GrpE [Nitrosomonas sp. Is24]MDV6347231.1 nucleotide exchange factor GrpE [Nitrosomonas sp. Is35]